MARLGNSAGDGARPVSTAPFAHTRQGLPVQAAAESAPARADLPPRVAPTVPPRSTAPVLIATFGAKEKPFEVLRRTVYSRETLTSFRDAVRASYPPDYCHFTCALQFCVIQALRVS